MRFSLRSLFLFIALFGAGLWCYQHLAVSFEYRPMTYNGTHFRFDYSVILEVH